MAPIIGAIFYLEAFMEEKIRGGMKDTVVAQRLGMSINTIRRWRIEGKGPEFVKMGRTVRYLPESVEKFLAQNQVNPGDVCNG